MAKSQDPAWTKSPILGCAAAEALIAAERIDAANEILARLREKFPAALRPRQLEGLVAKRSHDWKTAIRVFGALYAEDFRDPETVGMYAASWMVRYQESGSRLHLIKSRDLYREAFESSSDSYSGINAATKSLFLGERETAIQLAARVEGLIKNKTSGDYYVQATLAEARLLQGDYVQAAQLYDAAVLRAPGETGSHRGTLAQASEILKFLDAPPADRERVEQAFAHLKRAASV